VGCKTKTLITTRLMPTPLEGLAGVKHEPLTGLSQRDAVRFIRSEGVKGTRAELEQAGKVYDYHPLMLKLLTTSIRRSRAKDIKDAYGLKLIDKKEPHKILSGSFNLLSKEERHVASCMAVFRSAFKFDSANKALFPGMDEDRLWKVLQELRSLGFLFYDEDTDCFDFHPIMRSFLYNSLTHRAEVHTLAVRYFKAMPGKEKIISLDDLAPVIELYHHLAKAGKFDEAFCLFRDRIGKQTYYQLSAYHLFIELMKELFPEGEDQLPRLKSESDQGLTLNNLANSYGNSGHPAKALPLFFKCVKIAEKNENRNYLATGLENVADYAQFHICQFSASTAHLRKAIALCREIKDEFWGAVGHQRLGRVFAYQGSTSAEDEFTGALKLFKQQEYEQWKCIDQAYRSLSAFLQARLTAVLPGQEIHSVSYSREALEQARKALEFVEEMTRKKFPLPRDFVRAYWLLGEALIQCRLSSGNVKLKSFEINFYDEYFQDRVESIELKKGDELEIAERCLSEALRRCRKINLIYHEPDILLSQARLEWTKKKYLPNIEKNLKEAMDIAFRSGYRLKLADLHLFCGGVLLELKEKGPGKLFHLTAKDHLQKTKEYALDVSEFKDLYQSKDPHFYDNIPEYEMLKRGMTHEERIKNGYWIAYRIAEALELGT
jgi:tetratricopeptide (TPR) repeat protein